MHELLPIAGGVFAGSVLAFVHARLRLPVGAALVICLGVLATVATGEFLISWGFVLVDVPIVAVSGAVGLAMARRVRSARVGARRARPAS